MSGPGQPPEGVPEGSLGGGEDEYRSVVFDESFVRAARIQEFSARERLDDADRAVRIRHVLPRGLARQAMALVMLIVLAFGFAIYMGVRHPYKGSGGQGDGAALRVTVIPLVPGGVVPAVSAGAPFAGSSAAHYGVGEDGLPLPPVHRVGGYAESEVMTAYQTARKYLKYSALDARTVTGGDVRQVRNLLDPAQIDQFDSSLSRPTADGSHEATGWLVRFDPDPSVRVTLLGDGVRVHGTFDASENSDNQLEITADHTYVYAIRASARPDGPVSLFTVRRQLRFRFDHEELRQQRIEVVQADVAAGPLACSTEVRSYFRPIMAGYSAPGAVTGANPFDHDQPVGAVCASLTGVGGGTPVNGTPPSGAPAGGAPGAGTATAGSPAAGGSPSAGAGAAGSPAAGPPATEGTAKPVPRLLLPVPQGSSPAL